MNTTYQLNAAPEFRDHISAQLHDEFQRTNWNHTFAGMAENKMFIVEALAAPRNKLERLLSVDLIKRTLVGNHSLDLRTLINRKGILVVNLAKGLIGEDNAAILGNFLLSAIWQAMQSQAAKPKHLRVPVALFVVEVHNFANPAFEKMLSEGRGFGVQAAVAMQFMGQITDKKVRQAFESLLQNLFVFRTEQLEDAEYFAKVFMRVYGSTIQVDEQIQDRLNFGPDDMMNLPVYTALARLVAGGEMQPAFLGRTIDTAPFHREDWAEMHAIHTTSIGSLNSAIVHPREVFKAAILANASSIVLGHNHPSGDPAPSTEDIEVTTRLSNAGELMGIDILDHVIIGDGGFYSLKERGLL